jgi:hypothetical protein
MLGIEITSRNGAAAQRRKGKRKLRSLDLCVPAPLREL